MKFPSAGDYGQEEEEGGVVLYYGMFVGKFNMNYNKHSSTLLELFTTEKDGV